MSFTPLLPYAGEDGWRYLRETLADQKAKAEAAAPAAVAIEAEYFRQNVAAATTPERLVADTRLIRFAMDAFGLKDATPRVDWLLNALKMGREDEADVAKALGDRRWGDLVKAFGFGEYTPPRSTEAGFAEAVVARHRIQRFEESVGAVDASMRRALAFDRTMTSLAAGDFSPEDGWAQAVAHDETRAVLKGAFGLGPAFDAAPRAVQAEMAARAAARAGFADVAAFGEADARDSVIRRFLSARPSGAVSPGAPPPPGAGLAGFRGLARGLDAQQRAVAVSEGRSADMRHFTRRIGGALTAEALVADDRLMKVALNAFGLSGARPTADFLRRVLESDTADADSFANRQPDGRWAAMAEAFGYGDGAGPQVGRFGFAEEIAARHAIHSHEAAVGARDETMRIALIFERTVATLSISGLGEDAAWDRALGHPAMAFAFQQALGLDGRFFDQTRGAQTQAVRDDLRERFGIRSMADFARPDRREAVLRPFFAADAAPPPRGGLAQPVIPLPGLAGWRYLQQTLVTQQERFVASASSQREIAYFRDNIARVETADQLVADRRLLSVALEAFGLASEIDKGAFIGRILAEGSESDNALARKLADTRFRDFAAAFGFGDGRGPQTRTEGFADRIIARWKPLAFERAVGEVDESMRLALNYDRTIRSVASTALSETSGWFRILGDPPMRSVLETAFSLPPEFAGVALERQMEVLQGAVRRTAGATSLFEMSLPDARDAVLRRFFVQDQIAAFGAYTPGSAALTLLQSASLGSGGLNIRA